ncbi:hypothetical protein A9Q83_17450 [Alphaproteobacteria bacterium 46_93_T64]|nr:hypothetical protein A9Q83_17450 [Alphaproteobacteria bacterium 46_93_T64]
MNRSIEELKIRANKLQKSAASGDVAALKQIRRIHTSGEEVKRKTCLNTLALGLGFSDWTAARDFLSGDASDVQNRGTFWYSPKCTTLLNHWFVDYAEACEFLEKSSSYFLLPYKNQFIVVDTDYLKTLELWESGNGNWQAMGRNAVKGYNTQPWHELIWLRISSLRTV